MTNRSDFDKPEWRKRNLLFAQRQKHLWREDGKLVGGVVEVIGTRGGYALWEPFLRQPSDFLAVDNNPVVAYKHKMAAFRGEVAYRPVFQDVYQVILEPKVMESTAVYILDCTDSGTPKWWADYGPCLVKAVKTGLDVLGGCVLILNKTMDDPWGEGPKEVLEQNTFGFCETFRIVETSDVLQKSDLRQLNIKNFTGPLGAWDINKTPGRKMRMATIRAGFLREPSGNIAVHI